MIISKLIEDTISKVLQSPSRNTHTHTHTHTHTVHHNITAKKNRDCILKTYIKIHSLYSKESNKIKIWLLNWNSESYKTTSLYFQSVPNKQKWWKTIILEPLGHLKYALKISALKTLRENTTSRPYKESQRDLVFNVQMIPECYKTEPNCSISVFPSS